MTKIVVFGASGNIGGEVAKALARRNAPFRAVVHSAEKMEKVAKLGNNIEVVQADLEKPETVDKVLAGMERVFIMFPSHKQHLGHSLVDAIKRSGSVKHIVKLSGLGIDDTGSGKTFPFAVEHKDIEDYIRKQGIPLTALRPASFCSNLYNQPGLKSANPFYGSAVGDAKVNWISPRDIGEVAAISLIEGDKHAGKIYELTGPDTVTSAETAKLIGKGLGKEVAYVPQTLDQMRERLATRMPKPVVEQYIEMLVFLINGGYNYHSKDVETVTGSKGQSISEWVAENKAAFA